MLSRNAVWRNLGNQSGFDMRIGLLYQEMKSHLDKFKVAFSLAKNSIK